MTPPRLYKYYQETVINKHIGTEDINDFVLRTELLDLIVQSLEIAN